MSLSPYLDSRQVARIPRNSMMNYGNCRCHIPIHRKKDRRWPWGKRWPILFLSTVWQHRRNGKQITTRGSCHRTRYINAYGDWKTLTLKEFRQAQAADRKCQAAAQNCRLSTFLLTYDGNSVLVRQAPVDGALQKYIPITFRTHILYLSHYPTSDRRPV